jgi:hypothetical protein
VLSYVILALLVSAAAVIWATVKLFRHHETDPFRDEDERSGQNALDADS